MLEYELVELVNKILQTKCGSNYLEIKAAAEGCPELFDTLSSFSNQYGGGTIVFGIDENNGFDICGVYDPADLQKKIMEQALQMEPELRPQEHENRHLYRPADRQALRQAGIPRRRSQGADSERA